MADPACVDGGRGRGGASDALDRPPDRLDLDDADRSGTPAESPSFGKPSRVVDHKGDPGVVLAFDDLGLLKIAQQVDCVVELVPEVGDFVAPDDPLFRVYEGGRAVDEQQLQQ